MNKQNKTSLINVADDLNLLLAIMPERLSKFLDAHPKLASLNEIVLDLGHKPEVRFTDSEYKILDLNEIEMGDIQQVTTKIQSFNTDNRAGIERTLHRISCIRNRSGVVIGLTCRVGRAIVGTIEIIRDLVESNKNILFLGKPGIGKTTKLRETARVLADELKKRVIVVDTSNEIAGDGDIPHPGIGSARRMQVPTPDRQHAVMIEAVENHMPEVIIVDEIGTEEETRAARTISQRGVQLVATAHGHTLENLIKNPTLSDLAGGIQSVILGDEEAKFRGTQKTVLERKSLPTFDILIEIRERDVFAIYHDLTFCVDEFLRNNKLEPEIRCRDKAGNINIKNQKPLETEKQEADITEIASKTNYVYIYPYGLNVDNLYNMIYKLQVPAIVARAINEADLILTIKSQVKSKSKIQQLIQGRQIPMHVLKQNSATQIAKFLRYHFNLSATDEELENEAIREIKKICKTVIQERQIINASPQSAFYRRLQHQVVAEQGLNSMSVGEDPNRYVRVYPR